MSETSSLKADETRIAPFVGVWAAVIAVNLLELLLAVKVSNSRLLFGLLMTLALLSSGLVMAFFMHLKYERRSLVLSLIPALVFVLFMTIEMVPDAVRLHNMKTENQPMPAAEQPAQ